VAEDKETPQRPSIVDWLGPGPTVSIILTVGSAIVIAGLSIYSVVGAHADSLSHLTKRSDDHEERIREQEFRPPRLEPEVDKLSANCEATAAKVAVMDERIKSLESRIVGQGPEGWHRKDHDLYAQMMDERNARIRSRLDVIEAAQLNVCQRVQVCKGNSK
jgi:predicted RNase H-like nuclease (RuvC/YqgF family)